MNEPHKVDRTGWPHGPWDDEPDSHEWYAHGLRCTILRSALGCLCGYVDLPKGHIAYGIEYDRIADDYPELVVHWGLTYSNWHQGGNYWRVGFDCGHCTDITPRTCAVLEFFTVPDLFPPAEYRDMYYVHRETTELARQLMLVVG